VLAPTSFVGLLLGLFGGLLPSLAPRAALGAEHAPKYYFQLRGVEATVPMDGGLRAFVANALREELASRSEWASDVGATKDQGALTAELERRKLSGFDLVVKVTGLKKDAQPPKAGGHLQHLVVWVRLAVLGTTLPGDKIAFGGDGEATYETEVAVSRVDREGEALLRDAIRDALKQAADEAVIKLALPKSEPINESKRKRKKT
jgi:hypothetical protein